MGMDIYGTKPSGKRGEYFGNNAESWGPLAAYCQQVAPEITSACRYWYSNDYDGLDAAGALALAEMLQEEINAKRTDTYALRYASAQSMMPNEPCNMCSGTGVRVPLPHRGADNLKKAGIRCDSCEGAGYVRPLACHCSFSTENVADFAAFLRESGGFEIW